MPMLLVGAAHLYPEILEIAGGIGLHHDVHRGVGDERAIVREDEIQHRARVRGLARAGGVKDDRVLETHLGSPGAAGFVFPQPFARPRIAHIGRQPFAGIQAVGVAGRRLRQLRPGVNARRLPQIFGRRQWRLVVGKNFGAGFGAPPGRLRARNRTNGVSHNAGRLHERRGVAVGEIVFGILHEGRPNGGCAGQAGAVDHRAVVGVPHPHPHRDVGRVAHRPVIAKIVGGAGLGCGGEGQVQRRVEAEFPGAGLVVGKDGGDEVGVLWPHDLHPRGRGVFIDRFAAVVHNAGDGDRRHPLAPVGQHGIGRGVFQQRDLAAAQSERKAVIFAGQGGNAQPLGHADQAVFLGGFRVVVDAHELQRLHRRDVERICQRGAHRHRAVEAMVVIHRLVRRAGVVGVARRREFAGDVPDERRGRPTFLERGKVSVGLDGRAGLPRR